MSHFMGLGYGLVHGDFPARGQGGRMQVHVDASHKGRTNGHTIPSVPLGFHTGHHTFVADKEVVNAGKPQAVHGKQVLSKVAQENKPGIQRIVEPVVIGRSKIDHGQEKAKPRDQSALSPVRAERE